MPSDLQRRVAPWSQQHQLDPVDHVGSAPHMLSGFRHIPGYFDARGQTDLLREVEKIALRATPYRPAMPRSGKLLSVEMTNAGPLGWVTDKEWGYRYQSRHPVTGEPWPAIPEMLT